MTILQPNTFGCTKSSWWSDSMDHGDLESQLKEKNITFETTDIKHLVGMGGCAWLTFYTSPLTHQPVTVLCIPHRPEIDQFDIEYYYFEGLKKTDALDHEQRWLDFYDQRKTLAEGGAP